MLEPRPPLSTVPSTAAIPRAIIAVMFDDPNEEPAEHTTDPASRATPSMPIGFACTRNLPPCLKVHVNLMPN